MKRMIKLMSLAMVVAISITACSKEDSGRRSSVDKTKVQMQISDPADIDNLVRSEGDPIGTATVTFNDGYIYFVSPAPQSRIEKIVKILGGTDADEALDDDGTTVSIGINKLKAVGGAEIDNVPGECELVYVVGNLNSITSPVVGDKVEKLEKLLMTVESQYHNGTPDAAGKGSATKVTLYGVDDIVENNITEQQEAKVTLKPISARIEIGKFSQTATSIIDSYVIEGIFINDYYTQIGLAGAVQDNAHFVHNGSDDANDVYKQGSTEYGASLEGVLYDYAASGIGSGTATASAPFEVTPATAGKVWGYNVLAPLKDTADATTALKAPHIVVRVGDITTTDGTTYAGSWYFTISAFIDKSTQQEIPYLTPGTAYKISDLAFSHADLRLEPEKEAIPVYVQVVLTTWTTEEVDWKFN